MNFIDERPITIQEYRETLQKKTCSIKEFAGMLGISYPKALRLSNIDGAPVVKIGRDKRVILSKVDEFLENHVGECL